MDIKYIKGVRGSWGNISPVTKIIPNKKKYNRKKLKKIDKFVNS